MIGRRQDLDDLDGEIHDHIDRETEDNVARGMAPDAARTAAVRKFGNVVRVKEEARAVWLPEWIDRIGQDLRDGLRRLRRNPGISAAVILILALGIGLSTVAYSVVNAVLLRPLSYPEPERLVWLTTYEHDRAEVLSSIDFIAWRDRATSFERIVAYYYGNVTVAIADEAVRARVANVSNGFWEISGARPALGRLPSLLDREQIVLTHRFFTEQLRGDAGIVGRTITLNGQPVTVAAVLSEDFGPQLPSPQWRPGMDRIETDLYRPLIVQPPSGRGRDAMVMVFLGIGKLKPGVSLAAARAEAETLHVNAVKEWPGMPGGKSQAIVLPLHGRLVDEARPGLWIALGAVMLVLLITCANVANLLLARVSARQKEIALRMSVGGGPLRVLRQLIAESLVLAVVGGLGGVVFANWLITIVTRVMADAIPRLAETSIDGPVLAFALSISAITAFLFGIGPAVALCRTNVQEVLKDGVRTATASRRGLRAIRAVVALQLAMTVVLLSGAGLLLNSLWRINAHAPGFHPERILMMQVDFSGPHYRQQEARRAYVERVLAQVSAQAGVESVGVTTGGDSTSVVVKEGEPFPENPPAHAASLSVISPDFPRLIGMRLVRGQWLSEAEPAGVLINESLARREFATVDPIGKRIQMPWLNQRTFLPIVGVVGDLKYSKIDTDPEPELLVHYQGAQMFGITIAIRTTGDPMAAASTLRRVVADVDRTQSVFEVKTMEQRLADSIATRRFNFALLATFAFAAVILAALGIYGVVAYAVAERTHEIGIRLALGARRPRVVAMILRQAMVSVIAGIAIGIVAATALTRLIATLLYGVTPTDPTTLAAVAVLLTAIAAVACAAPAMKAALVDPVVALRYE